MDSDLERAKIQITDLERLFLAGHQLEQARALLAAMHEALRLASSSKLRPWAQTKSGSWVREPAVGAPVCIICGAGGDWIALLPAGVGFMWPFQSVAAAKTAVDLELEKFWGPQ